MFQIKKSLLLLAIFPFLMQTAFAENNALQTENGDADCRGP